MISYIKVLKIVPSEMYKRHVLHVSESLRLNWHQNKPSVPELAVLHSNPVPVTDCNKCRMHQVQFTSAWSGNLQKIAETCNDPSSIQAASLFKIVDEYFKCPRSIINIRVRLYYRECGKTYMY